VRPPATIKASLPSETLISAIPEIVRSKLAGIQPDFDLIVEPQPLLLRVTNGPSTYHPTPDGHLEISLYVLLSDTYV
jgi:hypothetical protein